MVDLRTVPKAARESAAQAVKEAYDVALPHLSHWNYALCRTHAAGWVEEFWDDEAKEERKRVVTDRPEPTCRVCGIHFRRHQRVGVSWLFLKKKALLADVVGSGKTGHAAGLIALMAENGELVRNGRVLLVIRAAALLQWQRELARMLPALNVMVAMGPRAKRVDRYLQPWDICLIGPEMLLRDAEVFDNINLSLILADDVDGLRNRKNKIFQKFRAIARTTDRAVIMTGTPLQKKLHELYNVLIPLGGQEALGTITEFENRFVQKSTVMIRSRGRRIPVKEITGYKNVDVFKELIQPFTLRRTADDIDDVHLPEVNPNDVYLELLPRQRARYTQLQEGILQVLKEQGAEVKMIDAMQAWHYGNKICAGMGTLDLNEEGPDASSKLNWILEQLTDGDLSDEKVVIFARFKDTLRCLQARLDAAGIEWAVIWGENRDKKIRQQEQDRFWFDPACKVMMGTQAMEQSLNLQVSRHLINIDQIMNPARMEQLAGRIRRDGSQHRHVFIHNLLTVDSQEERIMPVLEAEAAIASHVWSETSELYEALEPDQLLRLIAG